MPAQPITRAGRRRIAGERARTTPAGASPISVEADATAPVAVPDDPESGDAAPAGLQHSPATGDVPDDPGSGAGDQVTPGPSSRRLLSLLALGLLLVLVFDVVVAVRQHTARQEGAGSAEATSSAFDAAPAQAERAAEELLSYDYARLAADAERATALMTPDYAGRFAKTVDDFLAEPATEARGEVTAKVMASGVVSGTASRVEVLLFVDQTSITATEPAGRTALNRVLMSMVRDGERWLVDDVTAL